MTGIYSPGGLGAASPGPARAGGVSSSWSSIREACAGLLPRAVRQAGSECRARCARRDRQSGAGHVHGPRCLLVRAPRRPSAGCGVGQMWDWICHRQALGLVGQITNPSHRVFLFLFLISAEPVAKGRPGSSRCLHRTPRPSSCAQRGSWGICVASCGGRATASVDTLVARLPLARWLEAWPQPLGAHCVPGRPGCGRPLGVAGRSPSGGCEPGRVLGEMPGWGERR